MHDSTLGLIIKGGDGMHRATVIPHHDVVLLPPVAVNKTILCGMGNEFVEKCYPLLPR